MVLHLEVVEIKKYLTKDLSNEFLLSLNLCDGIDNNKIIKKLYAISNNVENNYVVFEIKKSSGKTRKIYAPKYNLKLIQKRILKNILEKIPVSNYAKGYVPSLSLTDNAYPHQKKKIILKLDIKDFFTSITFSEVLKYCFPYEYFPDSVAVLLTKLCTYYDYVPQGAPTSAYISNLVLKDFDEEIGNFCTLRNIAYTRYSDDLTFSGDFSVKEVISFVKNKLQKRGYLLNKEKIKVITRKNRQSVTGIVVNEKLQANKEYRKSIRKEMYYINKFGLNSHLERKNISDKEKYLMSLKGKINYCLQINPLDKEMKDYKIKLSKI